jgi:hypothetical protein
MGRDGKEYCSDDNWKYPLPFAFRQRAKYKKKNKAHTPMIFEIQSLYAPHGKTLLTFC